MSHASGWRRLKEVEAPSATLRELLDAGIVIAAASKVQLSREKAQKLYEIHRGAFSTFNRKFEAKNMERNAYLRDFRQIFLLGPVIAMRVNGDVRRILGSSHLYPLPTDGEFSTIRQRCALSDVRNVAHASHLYPLPTDGEFSTIRQRCALSDVRNVAHASDSEAAQRELALFEPLSPSKPFLDEMLGSSYAVEVRS
ncbi:unnamed protein product [Strongylus vulgaris]|uniref:Uncharacterized protein n=1 Tax=Strongylus vulgaris TaxID=40348 RepID=A0A3P7M2R2_STRVU|nr:unnamed protein product [Strongylus vulgaris]